MILGEGLRRGRVTAVVGIIVTLTACSGGSGNGTPSSPPPSSSAVTSGPTATSPTTTPVAPGSTATTPASSTAIAIPALPEAATHPTGPGAEAFFRYFLALYSASYATLNADALESVSLPTCKFCASAVKDIRAAKASGNRPVGGEVTPIVVVAAPGEPAKGVLVNSVIRQNAGITYDSTGNAVASASARPRMAVDSVLVWSAGRWMIGGVEVKS